MSDQHAAAASPRDRDRPRLSSLTTGAPAAAAHAVTSPPTAGGPSAESTAPLAAPMAGVGAASLPAQPPHPHHHGSGGNVATTGGNAGGSASSFAQAAAQDQVTLRCLVTSKDAGVIIGKGGANIKAIREESHARVTVSETVQGINERVISITGAIEEIAKAYAQVSRQLNYGELRTADSNLVEQHPATLKFLIPHSRMGAVIGKAGARIKEIQDESNARLAANPVPMPASQDRMLEMIGVPDAIHIATYHMLVSIKQMADRPLNDRPYRPDYMMQGGAGGAGVGGMPLPQVPTHGGMMVGGSGNGGGAMPQRGGYQQHGVPQQQQHMIGAYGGGPGVAYTTGVPAAAPMQQQQPSFYGAPGAGAAAPLAAGGLESRTFVCPGHKVGQLIGKQGAKINRIRQESGCKINIEDARAAGGDRPFVVTGHPRDVERAVAALEASLRRELARDANGPPASA